MSGALIKELRTAIASAVSDFKAYEVPNICSRIGLAEGTGEEAFASKFKYVKRRCDELGESELVAVAEKYLSEESSYALSEVLNKLKESKNKIKISPLTRKRIIAVFEQRLLVSEGEELNFITGLFPRVETTNEFGKSLKDEIIQHTIRNNDWSNSYLLERLGLLDCSQHQFFKFLCEVTNPIMQNNEAQAELVSVINPYLRQDGFFLAIEGMMSGSPVYSVTEVKAATPADESISSTLLAFDSSTVHQRWQDAQILKSNEPERAITLARTLLEDVCKWVLHEANATWEEDDDLPKLYKKLSKVLNLAPDDHTEAIFKQILSGCSSVVTSLGALRNKLSDAHSIGPKRTKPAPRHGELAVNLAGSMATFLVATWEARKSEATK